MKHEETLATLALQSEVQVVMLVFLARLMADVHGSEHSEARVLEQSLDCRGVLDCLTQGHIRLTLNGRLLDRNSWELLLYLIRRNTGFFEEVDQGYRFLPVGLHRLREVGRINLEEYLRLGRGRARLREALKGYTPEDQERLLVEALEGFWTWS